MESSFTDEENQTQTPAKGSADTQVAKQESQPPAHPLPAAPGLSGEVSSEDFRTPYLSLVGKTGVLADEFTPGHFVLNRETDVADGQTPIDITILKAHKFWVEDVPFDEDIVAKTFDRLEDAVTEGFSKEYGADRRVMPCLRSIAMIPVSDADAMFKFNGQGYALCMWMLQKTAYASAAKPIVTAALKGHLRDGLHSAPWALTSLKRASGKNTWYVPVVRKKEAHSAEFRQFIEEEVLLGFEE